MSQKGKQPGQDAEMSSCADIALPAQRRDLTPTGVVSVRNEPQRTHREREKSPARVAGARRGQRMPEKANAAL